MRSYFQYPNYKSSGVEWLGDVPSHWEVKRARFMLTMNPSKREIAAIPVDEEVSFFPMEAVGENGELAHGQTRAIDDVSSGYTYFAENDVTFAKITPCFENGKGAIMRHLVRGCGFGTTELTVLRCSDQLDPEFLFHVTKSDLFRQNGEAWMYGAGGQKRVPDEYVKNMLFSFPPLPEQEAIARFLDKETARLDGVIEKREKLIRLLREKRAAMISHAVTKGLNPQATMKPSGIGWVGDIPEGWGLSKIKFKGTIRYGIGEPPGYQPDGVPLIRATNVKAGTISSVALAYVDPSDIPTSRIVWLLKDDIIVVRSGAYTGDSAIIPQEYENSIAGFDMVVRPTKIHPMFLQYALLSNYLKDSQIDFESMRAAQPHLNAEELGACFLCVPLAREEQKAIADYLDRETKRIDDLVEKEKQIIERMKEYRSAIISAAVTGKIDVREYV